MIKNIQQKIGEPDIMMVFIMLINPTIPSGTNGKMFIPYLINKDCRNLTFTINDEYKVLADITEY